VNGSDVLPIFAWRFDGSDALVWSNPAWLEFARVDVRTPPSAWWTQVVHPRDAIDVATALADCRRTRAAVERAIRIRRPSSGDGTYHRVLWRFSPSDEGPGVVALGIDVRDAQRVDLRLDRNVDALRHNDVLAIAETIPVMVWRTDPQGFSDYFNARWYEYTGLTPEQSHGTGWTAPIHPDDLARTEDAWYESIHHGAPYDIEFRLRGADGRYRWFLVRGRALRGFDGSVAGWFGTCTDIDDQRTATEALAAAKMRAEFLTGAESILERSFDAPYLIADLAHHAIDAFASICFYDAEDEGGEVARLASVRRDPSERHAMISTIVVPIVARGRRFGVMTFGRTSDEPPFDAEDRHVAEELGRRAAASLEHARLYALARDNERRAATIADAVPQIFWTARRDGYVDWFNRGWYEYTGQSAASAAGWGWQAATHPHDFPEVMRRWTATLASGDPFEMSFRLRGADGEYRWFLTRFVPERDERAAIVRWYGSTTNVDSERRATLQLALFAELGDRLAALHTPDATLDAVVESLVPAFVDVAYIELVETNGVRLAAIEHRDPAARRTLRGLVGRRDDGTTPPVVLTSALASPLLVDGETRGILTIGFVDEAGSFADADRPFVEEIARRITPALVRAELFERERRIAETFQNAVLPRGLPEIAGLQFDALYEPGRAEALVGGDWYDAFRLLDGRVVISIGDVVGNGLAAATAMAEVRQSIRGAAAINPDPAMLLDAADRIVQANEEGRYATAWVGIVDPIDFSLRFASAGHPPPFLRAADGTVTPLFADGLPLGLPDTLAQRRASRSAFLAPGSVAVLYTDGLIENERDALAAEARLARALAAARPGSIAAHELRTAVLGTEQAHDDVAILVVAFGERLAETETGGRVRHWTFDIAQSHAAGAARRELTGALCTHGYPPDVVGAAEAIAGELLGNVQRYARGRADVILDLTADSPVVHVVDAGPGFAYNKRARADAFAESGRGLYIVGELAREFSVTHAQGGGSHARAVLETRGGSSDRFATRSPVVEVS
jgi:PAS domain S-box-containing protein